MSTGSALARFTITLSQAVTEPVQVEWFTSDGTAKATVDYAANKGTVVFAPGETAKTVDILVYGRAVGAEDRSFFVEMLPPTNAILGASIGECIITVDTSGSTPVTAIIVPTGPKGEKGDPGQDGISPDPEDIAEEVAPLIDVGDTVLTAEDTETLGHPDETTVKAIARRIAYASPAKIATVVLSDGDNAVGQGDMTGDTLDMSSECIYPRILRGTTFITPQWNILPDGKIMIKSAVSGDVLYVCQYDFISNTKTVTNTREHWRRTLADAGLNLVDGSFEEGATANVKTDAVWHKAGCQCYWWGGALSKVIPPNSTPGGSGGVSSGAWNSAKSVILRSQLTTTGSSFVNPTRVSAVPQGNFAQTLYYVTPEQFGAVGDGTLHKLSEFYATLALAQAVYPFVTDINQSIDWAAMQAADNFARGKTSIRCPARSKYYFSSLDTLMLGIDSVFIGGPQSDHFQGTRILKDKPAATPTTNIGDICIVKVKSATAAGSSDQFVRGVVFQGFSLEWANVAWMSAVKGDLSVCFHANEAIKAKIDISVWGGEWGVYGYGCWGMVGTLRVLSCHKGVYFDPVASTPEHPTSSGSTGSTTSFDLRVEIGGCPFPIYLDKCQYSRFTGYVEVLNSTEGAIWDSANETPVAIQLGRECVGLTFDMAVEFYNGLLLLADKDNKNINTNWEFIYTYTYNNASGPHTARYTIANKYVQTEVTIPSTSRAIFSFNDIGNDVTVDGMNMQPTSTSFNNLEAVDKYLYASLSGNRLFFNGGNVQCTSYLKVTRANKRVIDFYRNNGLADALKPGAGWFYLGGGMYEQSTWTTMALDANGVVWVASPAGFNLQKCEAYSVGGGGLTQGLGIMEVPTATLMKFILPGGNATRSIVQKSTVELIN